MSGCKSYVRINLSSASSKRGGYQIGLGIMRGKCPLLYVLRVVLSALILTVGFCVPTFASQPAVEKIRIQNLRGLTRIVLETNVPVEPNLFTMPKPDRLVVDLPEILWRIARPEGTVNNPVVQKYSFGLFQPGVSRLVLNLSGPTQVVRRQPSRVGRSYAYAIDLVLKNSPALPVIPEKPRSQNTGIIPSQATASPYSELPVASTIDPASKVVFGSNGFDPLNAKFDELGEAIKSVLSGVGGNAVSRQNIKTSDIEVVAVDIERIPDLAPEKSRRSPESRNAGLYPGDRPEPDDITSTRKPLRIVIDPGHGGRDPGTGTVKGHAEKSINLKFAKVLAALLESDGNYAVFMTRETDKSVKLSQRVAFAREKDADLFLSIHADWNDNALAKGSTAYTLSEEASVKALNRIAKKPDAAGKVAGVDLAAESADIARLLVDLARRETQARSVKFAELIVEEVAKETPVLRRPHRKDSFHVLKAPDMPSVLLELGFISNESDLKRLTSEAWRLKTAQAVKRAIDRFRYSTAKLDFSTKR